jgi:hypothetical protein
MSWIAPLSESCSDDDAGGPLNRRRACDLFFSRLPRQVHLPVAVPIDEWTLRNCSKPHAPLDLQPRDRSLSLSFPRMRDHDDVVAVGGNHPDQPDRVSIVEPIRLPRGRKRPLELDDLGRAAGLGRLRFRFFDLSVSSMETYRLTVCQTGRGRVRFQDGVNSRQRDH